MKRSVTESSCRLRPDSGMMAAGEKSHVVGAMDCCFGADRNRAAGYFDDSPSKPRAAKAKADGAISFYRDSFWQDLSQNHKCPSVRGQELLIPPARPLLALRRGRSNAFFLATKRGPVLGQSEKIGRTEPRSPTRILNRPANACQDITKHLSRYLKQR
jgi:hypothetical protein